MKQKNRWWLGALILHAVALVYSFVGNTAGYWGWGGLEGYVGVSFSYIVSVGVWLFSYSAYERTCTSDAGVRKPARGFYIGVHLALTLVLATQVNIGQIIAPRIVGEQMKETADGKLLYRVEIANPLKWGQQVRLVFMAAGTEEEHTVRLRLSKWLTSYAGPGERTPWSLLTATDDPHVYLLELQWALADDRFLIDTERLTAEPLGPRSRE